MKIFASRSIQAVVVLAVMCGSSLVAVAQNVNPQTATGAQTPGALGSYYNDPAAKPTNPVGSPQLPNLATLTQVAQRIDPVINFDNPDDNARPTGQNVDLFNITWLGTITIPTSGAYHFRAVCDDGGRFWISKTLPFAANPNSDPALWKDQGDTNIDWPPDANAGTNYVAGDVLYFRMEYYENGGGTTARFQWRIDAGGYVPVPAYTVAGGGLQTPGPCPTPALSSQSVPGAAAIQLSWPPPVVAAGQTPASSYNIFRGTTTGGPYVWVGNSAASPFIDTGVVGGPLTFGSTYFYVIQGVYSEGTYVAFGPPAFTNTNPRGEVAGALSNESVCIVNPFAIAPLTVLAIENGGIGTITITTSAAIPLGTTVNFNIVITAIGGGAPAFTGPASVSMPGNNTVGQQVQFQVVGVDDNKANLIRSVTVQVGPSQAPVPSGFNGHTLPPVTCTTIETDIAGVIINPNNLSIVNGGTAITFEVTLTTQPDYDVTLTTSLTMPYAAVVTPGTLTFTTGNWNNGPAHTVTVTPNNVDTTLFYLTSFYVDFTPVTSLDANYNNINPGRAYIFEATSTPPLSSVWGSKACGLTGVEGLVVLGLLRFRRRRRNS